MKIAITGASGFVGRQLIERLTGHDVRKVSTRGEIRIDPCDVVINLAGEPVAQRWTESAKRRIRSSRIEGTRRVIEALRPNPPRVLISASAIGYYGSRGDEILPESSPPGSDFLAQLSKDWEQEALAAERLGIRVVLPRLAVVLGRDGGALAKMIAPFKLGFGGRLGDGKQWLSWIHLDDVVSMILFAMENESVRGPLNAASPAPVLNAEFTRELASVLHRPAIFPVPRFALRLFLGEMAGVILASQRVIPERALQAGFKFQFDSLPAALENLLR
jgi:uncharacterized protein (TIGR01777 family)